MHKKIIFEYLGCKDMSGYDSKLENMNITNRTIQFYKIKGCDIDMEPLGISTFFTRGLNNIFEHKEKI